MRASVEQASIITITLTQQEARLVLDDWDTSKEPSSAGKVLYSALVEVANPHPVPPTLAFPPGVRSAGGSAYQGEVTQTNGESSAD